ncbi:MAG: beta-ketoacyl-[acyl-carrier-protein] synthase family protein [Bacteroidetes bacterium]|nr:beta-ketoacyl-[acyl-carrier-protein] synthase family protein [Bacteroidota bacterium]MBL7104468.1 beta-ketoacyl-[acyl-carrier-protein] synthase family protein [Bacteroidales bacterium]
MTKVFVTGMGVISSIGKDINENLENLRNGNSGINKPKYFQSKYASSFFFGEANISTKILKKQLGLSEEKGLTRTDLFAFKAFEEAINDAKLSKEEISSIDTALISASTVGGMCLTDQLYEDANLKSESSEYLASYGCSAHTLRLIKKYNIKGFTDTINTACSSSANAIMFGSRLIKSGRVKRAIVGGTDSLAKYTVNGFNALKILSESPCKPFDEHRCGLTLGEGAAYLVLESEEVVSNKSTYARVSGYGNANDAFHTSTISDNAVGVISAISQAIKSAKIDPDKIDYINAHGTGTENNDFVELTGFSKIFNKIPPYNSTKSYTGHTLGAAGAIEAIFSILSIINNELYPSLNINTPVSQFNLSPVKKYETGVDINYVLSNSFGFGGNCTSLILSKV